MDKKKEKNPKPGKNDKATVVFRNILMRQFRIFTLKHRSVIVDFLTCSIPICPKDPSVNGANSVYRKLKST